MSSVLKLDLNGDGAWPDLAEAGDRLTWMGDGTVIQLATLAGGMDSGRPSVAFRLDLPDGRIVCAEMSWLNLAIAAQAIAARYGWPV